MDVLHSFLGVILLSQNNNIYAYNKAKVPADFTNLLGIGEEQYCRYAWSKHINPKKNPKKESAWQAIGHRQSGKPVTSLLNIKLNSEGYVKALGRRICSLDVFLSPNQFFDWRNTKQLAQLHANWIDIDTVNHEVMSIEQQEVIFSEIRQIIRDKELPQPTGFVFTGSGGMHLYWIYEGTPAYKWRVRIWREITLVLAKTFKKCRSPDALWTVDFSASRDPARVLRLPGTFHGKSGRIAEAYLGGPYYDFNVLAKQLITSEQNIRALEVRQNGNVHDIPTKSTPKPKPVVTPVPKPSTSTGKHTIGQWWFRIYSVVCSHGRKHGVPVGQRDLYAFILFVAFRHMKPTLEEALEAVKALNHEFIKLDDDELMAYLKTAIRTHYKYSKDTVAMYLDTNLGISSQFLYDNTKTPLTPEQVRERQQDAAKKTADTRRTDTLTALRIALRTLVETRLKVTQEAVAALSERSARTVRRYWSELKRDLRTLAPPLDIPAPEVLATRAGI
jgi:hypothetical protein